MSLLYLDIRRQDIAILTLDLRWGSSDVEIRLLSPDDAVALRRIELKNKKMLEHYLGYHGTRSASELRMHLKTERSHFTRGKAYPSGIFLNRTQLIGRLGLQVIDRNRSIGYLGYWLDESLQKQGLMTSCLRRFCEFCFEKLKLDHLDIACSPENFASIALAKRVGFQFQPQIRDFDPVTGVTLAILTMSKPGRERNVCDARLDWFCANLFHYLDPSIPEFCYPAEGAVTGKRMICRSPGLAALNSSRQAITLL